MNDSLSAPLIRVLAENSQKPEYALNFAVRDAEPTEDGTFVAIRNLGQRNVPSLAVWPYCTGGPGSTFSFRLWGWWNWGDLSNLESSKVIWLPTLIAEFDCTAGTWNGWESRKLKANEFLCSEITLVAGSLGDGRIYAAPDSPGMILIDLPRPRKIQFDFKQGDATPGLGNALMMQTAQA